MHISLHLRILALLFAAVTAQTSDTTPEETCLGNCFNTVLSKTPSPQGCGKIATATDIENCVCTSNTFAEQVGECLGGTCPDIAQAIAQNVVSFCQNLTPGGSPSSDAAGEDSTTDAAGAEPTSGGTSGSGTGGNSGVGNGGSSSSSGDNSGLGILGGSGKGAAAGLKAPVLGLVVVTGLSLLAMC